MRKEDFVGRGDNEKQDCVVRAFTVASGRPYPEVHALFKKHGRKDGRATRRWITDKVAIELGLKEVRLRPRRTFRKFVDDVKYIPTLAAFIKGHAFGVRSGILADYQSIGPNCRVNTYFLRSEAT